MSRPDLDWMRGRAWAATADAVEALPPSARRHTHEATRLRVRGLLVPDDATADYVGGTSYASLAEALASAVEGGAKSVVLEVDSPGGDVAGCHELAEAIALAPIEVVAQVTGSAKSAAYWLCAACDRIDAAPTAVVGGLGVLVPVPSQRGYAVATLSPRKSSPDDPQWQAVADELAEVMLGDIARWRGFPSAAAVAERYGFGAVFGPGEALARGLIDRVGFAPAPTEGGASMALKHAAKSAAQAQEAEAPPAAEEAPSMTLDEALTALREALAKIAELEAQLTAPAEEAVQPPEPVPAEDEDEDEEKKAMAAELARLRVESRELRLDQLEAAHKLAPADREVAAELYDGERLGRHRLFSSRYVERETPAVPIGRKSHGHQAVPQAVETTVTLHDRVLAQLAAVGKANTPSNYRAVLAALKG